LALSKNGDTQRALRAFSNAISLEPENKVFYEQGMDHSGPNGEWEWLIRLSRYRVHLQPEDAARRFQLGGAWHERGEFEKASVIFRTVLTLEPSNATDFLYLASCDQELGHLESAITRYGRVLQLAPTNISARMNRCSLALQLKRNEHAISDGRCMIVLDPGLSDAYYNLGLSLQGFQDLANSWISYSRVITLMPGQPLAYLNRGSINFDKNKLAESARDSQAALILDPSTYKAYVNLGNTFKQQNNASSALRLYNQALHLMPQLPDALSGKGLILLESLQFDAASACFDEAIQMSPDDAGFKYNKAHLCLLRGDYSKGWPLFEWRWQTKSMREEKGPERIPEAPLWLGQESLQGKRILIWPEQGFGDALQFSRYIPELVGLGADVVFEVAPALKRLMADSFPEAKVITSVDERGVVDAHCPLMSLPLAFSTTLDTIPGQRPYLCAQPRALAQFGDLLENASGLKVGLVWSGGLKMNRAVNARRNIDLMDLGVLRSDGVTFFSLQKGEPAESQLRLAQQRGWNGPEIRDVADRLQDFADTAVILSALDLVISVDTSTAHLAAALGKPVWLLNRFDTCWRWLAGRDDSPWYPTVRLFRQDESRSWDPVIQGVAGALTALAKTSKGP
jgi:tetratricopeptide (TPR) repeat protein